MLDQNRRPVFLNLFLIRFPITAIASGIHRISGVFLFFMIPFLLERLQRSLFDGINFAMVKQELGSPFLKLAVAVGLWALLYHFIAGIRHLLMDVHVGESAVGGRVGAWVVFCSFAVGMIGVMVWLF